MLERARHVAFGKLGQAKRQFTDGEFDVRFLSLVDPGALGALPFLQRAVFFRLGFQTRPVAVALQQRLQRAGEIADFVLRLAVLEGRIEFARGNRGSFGDDAGNPADEPACDQPSGKAQQHRRQARRDDGIPHHRIERCEECRLRDRNDRIPIGALGKLDGGGNRQGDAAVLIGHFTLSTGIGDEMVPIRSFRAGLGQAFADEACIRVTDDLAGTGDQAKKTRSHRSAG